MKKVNDIIWSDLINDKTSIAIFDCDANWLSSPYINCHRYYDDIEVWGEYKVDEMVYFPDSNRLNLYLEYQATEGELYD